MSAPKRQAAARIDRKAMLAKVNGLRVLARRSALKNVLRALEIIENESDVAGLKEAVIRLHEAGGELVQAYDLAQVATWLTPAKPAHRPRRKR